jgi:ferric-dicitrate binding protein FerR (iron transport regulator)
VTPPPAAFVNIARRVVVPLDAPTAVLHVQSMSSQAIEAALRWRHQRFEFTDVPLKEVVRLFNRQNEQKLELEGKVADLRISGFFWLDDPEGASRLIASSAGLQAIHHPGQRIMLRQP